MTASEWIWTKIGFGPLVLVVFVGAFVVISIFNENLIGKAGLGAVFALFGVYYSFVVTGGYAPFEFSWRAYGKELLECFALGMASTLVVLLW
jgi:hypothetical protein